MNKSIVGSSLQKWQNLMPTIGLFMHTKITTSGNFLQIKVSTFGNFKSCKTIVLLTNCQFRQFSEVSTLGYFWKQAKSCPKTENYSPNLVA